MEIDDLPANDNIETGNGLSEPTAPSESLKDAMESNAALYDEAFRSVPQSLAEDDDDLSKENKPSESACSTESPAVEMEVDSEPEQPTPMVSCKSVQWYAHHPAPDTLCRMWTLQCSGLIHRLGIIHINSYDPKGSAGHGTGRSRRLTLMHGSSESLSSGLCSFTI